MRDVIADLTRIVNARHHAPDFILKPFEVRFQAFVR